MGTPKDIRAGAVFEAHKNLKTGLTQVKNKTIKSFNISYQSV